VFLVTIDRKFTDVTVHYLYSTVTMTWCATRALHFGRLDSTKQNFFGQHCEALHM